MATTTAHPGIHANLDVVPGELHDIRVHIIGCQGHVKLPFSMGDNQNAHDTAALIWAKANPPAMRRGVLRYLPDDWFVVTYRRGITKDMATAAITATIMAMTPGAAAANGSGSARSALRGCGLRLHQRGRRHHQCHRGPFLSAEKALAERQL